MNAKLLMIVAALAFVGCAKKDAPTQAKNTSTASTKAKTAAPKSDSPKKEAKAIKDKPAQVDAKAATKPKAQEAANAKPAPTNEAKAKTSAAAPAKDAQPAPGDIPAPADVASVPANATKTPSGLASRVLKKGTGKAKPGTTDIVKVHYTGWMTNGKMFDSSVKRNKPATFPLNRVIKGWTEGVALMVVGEKRRFWIPGKLAYGDKPNYPGRPYGMLVFDVELLEIEKGPSEAEMKAQFTTFAAALKSGADATCACKDMKCAQAAMVNMRKVQPPKNRPTKEQFAQIRPDMQRLQECRKKLASAGKPAAGSQPVKGAPPKAPVAKPIAKDIPAPSDVGAVPANATKTASGLASRVLRPGTGSKKPVATDTVKVHYTGWMTNGKMFDSSVKRGRPASFPLNGVIKGWTEGVALMVEGEKRRFWIPANLAYGDTPRRPGGPHGMLVFDVELLEIEKGASPAEVKAQFAAFKTAALKTTEAVCACKDLKCVQTAMMAMRKVPPPKGKPTREQIESLRPSMKRLQDCRMKLQKAAIKNLPQAQPKPTLPGKVAPKPTKKAAPGK